MAATRTPAIFRSTRLFAALLASSATLLTACGGGGGSGSDPGATPQSLPAGSFAAIETGNRDATGKTANQIQIVDITQASIVAKYDVAPTVSTDYPSRSWAPIYQVRADANGLGYQQLGISQIAFIQSGKLMLLDLTGKALGTPRQLSNASDVCSVDRENISYVSTDGRHAWLIVTTAGPDGDCTQTSDNLTRLVSTDMLPGDTLVNSGLSTGLSIAMELRDITGQAQNLLVFNRNDHTLSIYTTDLKKLVRSVSTGGKTLDGTEAVRQLIASPTDYRQALLQVGSNVYLSTWDGTNLNLGAPLIQNLSAPLANSSRPVVVTSSDRFYLGDGTAGYAFSAAGVPLAQFSFPAGRGNITAAGVTDFGVVVQQSINSGQGGASATPSSSTGALAVAQTSVATTPMATLWSINGSNGTYRELANSSVPVYLLSVHGNTVIYSNMNFASQAGSIFKIDATATNMAQTEVASSVNLVDVVTNTHSGGLSRVDKVLLCTPTALIAGTASFIGCANGTLASYDTATGASTNMGTLSLPASTGVRSSSLWGVHETWTNRNSLIELTKAQPVSTSTYTVTSEVWMLNPSTANSLQRLTPLP
ncbi:MAG: hypothetical protein EKK47_19305 [Burkholderiales bacterium]|nr:MAG: hypothetical protein EKK47_19305 [Burkholderiales bacterium]